VAWIILIPLYPSEKRHRESSSESTVDETDEPLTVDQYDPRHGSSKGDREAEITVAVDDGEGFDGHEPEVEDGGGMDRWAVTEGSGIVADGELSCPRRRQ